MDTLRLVSQAADQDMGVVVNDRKLAHHAYVDLIAHFWGIGTIVGEMRSRIPGVGD